MQKQIKNMHLILLKKRRLHRADKAFTQGAYTKAFKLSHSLVDAPDRKFAFQANRLCGLALYKRKKYDDCLPFMEKSCQLGNYRHDWYNLAMASAFAGNIGRAEEAFKNIYRTNVQPGYMFSIPVPGLLYQYMKALKQMQFTEAAQKRANELKQMYAGVGSDTEKQVQRGLPSFPMFQKEIEALFPKD